LREQYNLFCLGQVPDDRGKIAAVLQHLLALCWLIGFVQLDPKLSLRQSFAEPFALASLYPATLQQEYDLACVELDQVLQTRHSLSRVSMSELCD